MRTQFDEGDITRTIEHLATRIAAAFPFDSALSVIGIRTRGEMVARRLAVLLRQKGFTQLGLGVLDITFYRDDLSHAGAKTLIRPTDINFDISGRAALLVDDVISTGRSIRAALDALTDFGFRATKDRVHINDLHATILKLLGLDHEKLTFLFQGRQMRLTDVGGQDDIAAQLLA